MVIHNRVRLQNGFPWTMYMKINEIKLNFGTQKSILRSLFQKYNSASNSKDIWERIRNTETLLLFFTIQTTFPNSSIYQQVKSEKEFHSMLIGLWKYTLFYPITLSSTVPPQISTMELLDLMSISLSLIFKRQSFNFLITSSIWLLTLHPNTTKKIKVKKTTKHLNLSLIKSDLSVTIVEYIVVLFGFITSNRLILKKYPLSWKMSTPKTLLSQKNPIKWHYALVVTVMATFPYCWPIMISKKPLLMINCNRIKRKNKEKKTKTKNERENKEKDNDNYNWSKRKMKFLNKMRTNMMRMGIRWLNKKKKIRTKLTNKFQLWVEIKSSRFQTNNRMCLKLHRNRMSVHWLITFWTLCKEGRYGLWNRQLNCYKWYKSTNKIGLLYWMSSIRKAIAWNVRSKISSTILCYYLVAGYQSSRKNMSHNSFYYKIIPKTETVSQIPLQRELLIDAFNCQPNPKTLQ